jgi:Ca-activated chloride channel homolog
VSFASPLVLLGLLAVPALAALYVTTQRQRVLAERAFTAAPLALSPMPRTPGPRRYLAPLLLALALAALIVAAARPQHRVTVPVKAATIVLVNDVSDSMASTDVSPSRLGAAQKAAITFLDRVPSSVAVGSIEFARHPIILQTPTKDHQLTRNAVESLRPGGGGTAIGEAIQAALNEIETAPKVDGKRPPGAIVLLSDGTSNVGIGPVQAATQAKQDHVKVYTIALGTSHGTITGTERGRTTTIPVPVSPGQLAQTAQASGGRTFRAGDSADASAVYAHLAKTLGHTKATKPLIAGFVVAGLLLLLAGGVATLNWFARLA